MSNFEFILKKVEVTSQIMEGLIDVATSDRVVNEEEKALLHTINNDLHKYLKTILEMLGNEKFDKALLERMERELVANCEKVALSDGIISEDEKKLLDELRSLVLELGQLI
ncbi:MAG: hypothetical protein D6732_14615 [Methanobacteriota archaeon]|nr:MAG: hypothetical protein D6732_14615 [Euryarchaeota archaeon]